MQPICINHSKSIIPFPYPFHQPIRPPEHQRKHHAVEEGRKQVHPIEGPIAEKDEVDDEGVHQPGDGQGAEEFGGNHRGGFWGCDHPILGNWVGNVKPQTIEARI